MLLNVIEAKGVIFEGNAEQVILPGEDGELVVLDFHQSLLCCLQEGSLLIKPLRLFREGQALGEEEYISIRIKYGIARMRRNELAVMVERN